MSLHHHSGSQSDFVPPSRASTASIPPQNPRHLMQQQQQQQQHNHQQPGPIFPSQQRMLQQQNNQMAYNHQLMNQLMDMNHQPDHAQAPPPQPQIGQSHISQNPHQPHMIHSAQTSRDGSIDHSQMVPSHSNSHSHSHSHPHPHPYGSQEAMLIHQNFPQHPHMNSQNNNPSLPFQQLQFPSQIPQQMQVHQHFTGIAELTADSKKKGNNFRAMNDKELRQLLSVNENRDLTDVAKEVKSSEHSPRAEKTKQLFAMIWLQGACVTAKRSTPRSRVYASYAARCGTEHVTPLNPASFGKLVRVIFPGIKTRRLGVRGESKYHYVDLVLKKELENPGFESPAFNGSRASVDSSAEMSMEAGSIRDDSIGPLGIAAANQKDPRSRTSGVATSRPSMGRLFANLVESDTRPRDLKTTHDINLQFSTDTHSTASLSSDDIITLPDIYEYAPPKTDVDAAEALMALYRSHCTSLIDCVRFCKEKQFFRLFTSFPGTLTVPVQKLLTHANVAAWVRECDKRMYQKMIRFVNGLALQVVPSLVITFFEAVVRGLVAHLHKTFSSFPPHLLVSRTEPATVFTALLRRMLKVNRCAHEAAALLMQEETRNQMWTDWVKIVHPIRIIESEMPIGDYTSIYRMLTRDIRDLLMPTCPEDLEVGTCYEDASIMARVRGNQTTNEAETPVDRIAAFLNRLPEIFPNTDTRAILQTTTCLFDAAMRDFALASAQSFGNWWLTKLFVDEMGRWLAEVGGFLLSPASSNTPLTSLVAKVSTETIVPAGSNQIPDAVSANVAVDSFASSHMLQPNDLVVPLNEPNNDSMISTDNSEVKLEDSFVSESGASGVFSIYDERFSPKEQRSASTPQGLQGSQSAVQLNGNNRPLSRLPPTGSFAVSKRRKPLGRSVSAVTSTSARRVFSAALDDKLNHQLTPPVTPDLVASGLSSATKQTVNGSAPVPPAPNQGTGLSQSFSFSAMRTSYPNEDGEELDDSGIGIDSSFGKAGLKAQQQQQQQFDSPLLQHDVARNYAPFL